MEDLLIKLEKARKELSESNAICFTSDMDWASDYAIKKTLDFFDAHGVPLTVFVTNPSEVVNEYRELGKIRCGIHPNFMPDSSQGKNYDEVLDYCFKLLPDAECFRAHRYYDVNDTMDKLVQRGILYESNVCTLMDTAPPFLHRSKTISFPIFWEDGAFLYYVKDFDFSVMEKRLSRNGLKIINIHPMHFMLNTPYFSYTREIKDKLSREEWNNLDEEKIDKLRFPGEGITSYIEKIVETVKKKNIKTVFLKDVYEWILAQ